MSHVTVRTYRSSRHSGYPALVCAVLMGLLLASTGATRAQSSVTAPDGMAYAAFGQAIAVTANTLVVGAPGQAFQGAVYVFTKTATGWALQAELKASDGAPGDDFGLSVAVSGSTLAIGAPYKTINGNGNQGAVYVFTKTAKGWTQQAELTVYTGYGIGLFGSAVAVSGTTLAVGSPYENQPIAEPGVYVYNLTASGWQLQTILTASDDASGNFFGFSLALRGNTLVVGALYTYVNGHFLPGAAYVFTQAKTSWQQTAELMAADGMLYDWFGYSVSFSGNTLVVGAPHRTVSGDSSEGSAYVFEKRSSGWTQVAEFLASGSDTGGTYGVSVATDGQAVVVGCPALPAGQNPNKDVVYVYKPNAGVWQFSKELYDPTGVPDDEFGVSVGALGTITFIGAPDQVVNGNNGRGDVFIQP